MVTLQFVDNVVEYSIKNSKEANCYELRKTRFCRPWA